MQRKFQLEQWLVEVLENQPFTLTTASADASFRRYFRVHLSDKTLIAMDAPPPQEDCKPFVNMAKQLLDAGLNVPIVIAENIEKGFLLLTDLGDDTYLSQLDRSAPNFQHANSLYADAYKALIKIQLASHVGVLPPYDEELLTREMQLLPDWYIAKHLDITLNSQQQMVLEKTFTVLNHNILAQPKVFVHRDYHTRNLMITKENNPGVLDFQDAVYGPITYDIVSLLKDAYISWEEDQLMDWVVRYWQLAKAADLPVREDFGEFYRDFEWMGVQRHIKILGIFARLYHRDGKKDYLKDMPLVIDYLKITCERYVELWPFLKLLLNLEKASS